MRRSPVLRQRRITCILCCWLGLFPSLLQLYGLRKHDLELRETLLMLKLIMPRVLEKPEQLDNISLQRVELRHNRVQKFFLVVFSVQHF